MPLVFLRIMIDLRCSLCRSALLAATWTSVDQLLTAVRSGHPRMISVQAGRAI